MKFTLFLLGLLAVLASPVTAALTNFQSGSLTKTNRECNGSGGTPSGPSYGTVQVVRTLNQLSAVPILLRGTPNTEYYIRLIQIRNGNAVKCDPCPLNDGKFKTNAQGVGNGYVQQTVATGATSAFVVLNKVGDCGDYFTIPPVPIT